MAQPFFWFQGASVRQLIADLTAAGPDCRLEVRVNDHDMTLLVVPLTAAPAGGPIDDSHICPPSCP